MDSFERLLWWLFAGSVGAKTRALVLYAIRDRPRNAWQLSQALGLDYTTVRHHLKVLESNRLIISEGNKYGKMYFVAEGMEQYWDLLGKILVPIIILIGIIVGIAASFALLEVPSYEPPYSFRYFVWSFLAFHVILSTVALVLLIALLFVYLRIYSETRARFALGLVIVLGALLLHGIFTYPLLLPTPRDFWIIPGPFFDSGDILMIIAYTVFLYLSLE